MGNVIDLYARAAATLYGIINFNDFFKILDTYYGNGSLSKARIMTYFWTSTVKDPVYYIQDELIVHASIPPAEVVHTLSDIQHPVGVKAPQHYRILPEKEFLQYANPRYIEDSPEARKMETYLINDLGLSRDEARETVAEMVYICRTGSCPALIMDALTRRGYSIGKGSELDLIVRGIDLEAGTRQWERLGATGKEMANR